MFLLRRVPGLLTIFDTAHLIRNETRGFAKTQVRQPQKQLQQLLRADAQYLQKQRVGILQLFPNANATLRNMFHNLSVNLDPSYKCQHTVVAVGRIKNQLIFQSTLTMNWPRPLSFSGYGVKKKESQMNATVKALELLYNENMITDGGYPVTVSQNEKEKLIEDWTRPLTITIPPLLMEDGWRLIDEFGEEVQSYLSERNETSLVTPCHREESDDEMPKSSSSFLEEESDQDGNDGCSSGSVLDLLTGREYVDDPSASYKQSKEMYTRLTMRENFQDTDSIRKKPLPMSEYKDVFEKALNDHQVVIVAGDTGCGKSTQVPQIILDKWIKEGRGADCNILISQPRRISAISLAKYIAHDRREKLGESIGYHVRLNYKRLWERGGVMFLTTGMLLQGLHSNPALRGVSHVIVDEVHERSVPTDLLLILLRRLIHSNKNLKLIVMSASLSTVELQNFFGRDESALIEVPGALYPLTRHYLGDSLKELEVLPKKYQLGPLVEPGSHAMVNIDLVLNVISSIDTIKGPGAILCFLPGWQDISVVQMRLQENPRLKNRLWVLPLHSRLPSSEQEQIFEAAPDGLRKVVLATNIAETSVTVEDVVYVVDTGCHKEQRYDARKDLSVLGNHWISRANSQQRAGRAGRVQPGEVFHLYSDNIHENMSRFPVPEILRIPLEHVVLQCKAHCGEESALTFLSDALSVPSDKLVRAAVRNLENLGMLKVNSNESTESLTPLGRRVVHFSTPPHISKALVYSSIFRCVDPALSIAATLTSGRGIFLNSIEMRPDVRKAKLAMSSTSDLLALLGLIQQWDEMNDYRDRINYCNDNNLSNRGLMFNNGIKKVYGDHLRDGFMVDDSSNLSSQVSVWNVNSGNSQLLLGILLAGVNRILLLQKGVLSKGILRKNSSSLKSLEGAPIKTGSDCVLHTIPEDLDENTRFLLCVHLTRDDSSRRTVARDLSIIEPLTVALFAGQSIYLKNFENDCLVTIDGKRKLSFLVDKNTGNFLRELRNMMQQMVDITIETQGLNAPLPPNFEHLRDRLVHYVSYLLENKDNHEERTRKRRTLYDDDEDWW